MATQKPDQNSQKPRNPQFSMKQRAAIAKYYATNPKLKYERVAEWVQ